MRFLVLSDLHGSTEAFLAARQAFQAEKADRMILCGDYLYHGPRNRLPIGYEPKDLAPELNTMRDSILAVRGNCDAEVDQMLLDFPMMSDYAVLFDTGRQFFVTHGHLYSEEHRPYLAPGSLFISGHTHIPLLKRSGDGVIFLNPGSTTLPKASSKPGYAVVDPSGAALKELHTGKTVAALAF